MTEPLTIFTKAQGSEEQVSRSGADTNLIEPVANHQPRLLKGSAHKQGSDLIFTSLMGEK